MPAQPLQAPMVFTRIERRFTPLAPNLQQGPERGVMHPRAVRLHHVLVVAHRQATPG